MRVVISGRYQEDTTQKAAERADLTKQNMTFLVCVSVHFFSPSALSEDAEVSQGWNWSGCGCQGLEPHVLSVQPFQGTFSPMDLRAGNPSDWVHSPWGGCENTETHQAFAESTGVFLHFCYSWERVKIWEDLIKFNDKTFSLLPPSPFSLLSAFLGHPSCTSERWVFCLLYLFHKAGS